MMKFFVACSNDDIISNHDAMAFSCDMEIKCLYCSIDGQNSPSKKKSKSLFCFEYLNTYVVLQ
jgi:hypothetical protein